MDSAAALLLLLLGLVFLHPQSLSAFEILSNSRLESCVRTDDSDRLDCNRKIVVEVGVRSGESGGETSIVAKANGTHPTTRDAPVITVSKSPVYAVYELKYLKDVAYRPREVTVETRKCEPDASEDILKECVRLIQNGSIIEKTRPVCCPCGSQYRHPTKCHNNLFKGKTNTAHCLKLDGDGYHVFGIEKRSIGFSVRVKVRKGSSVSEVIVGPDNSTVLSEDNFLRVSVSGDFVSYTSIPSFEGCYLVTPRLGDAGQPIDLGTDYSKWMLLGSERFTLDGLECNKIGVSYEAFNGQPDFCSTPLSSCLQGQLWNYWDEDQNRIAGNLTPIYVVEGRFERINQHPNAGTCSFSIGITDFTITHLLVELRADDIDFVYQRSPGKILGINIPTFEALTQFGTAEVTTKNTGTLEASYSMTFHCLPNVSDLQEQPFTMKPEEVIVRTFSLYTTTDQAEVYKCTAILKYSDYGEADRAECQFTTTATILDNGSQIVPVTEPKDEGIHGIIKSIKSIWRNMWDGVLDFFSGKTCSESICSSFFDLGCHLQYICVSWILMFGLLLAVFPIVIVLLWLLYQKGFLDHDQWDDPDGAVQRKSKHKRHKRDTGHNGEDDAHPRDRKHAYYRETSRKRINAHCEHHKNSHSEIATGDRHHHSHLHAYEHKHSKDFREGQ